MTERTVLKPNKLKAVKALLSSSSIAESARVSGISVSTLQRWLSQPEFKAELTERQDAMLSAVSAGLSGVGRDALTTLHTICISEDESTSNRIRASKAILDSLGTFTRQLDYLMRLQSLEKIAAHLDDPEF